MLVLTGQRKEVLNILQRKGIVKPDKELINHRNAIPCYLRLFNDYNEIKNTDFDSFFWGFTRIFEEEEVAFTEDQISRMEDMIGKGFDIVLLLDIPEELLLETGFYNFADEIFTAEELGVDNDKPYEFPKDFNPEDYEDAGFLPMDTWKYIYDTEEDREVQAIFPYILKEWIKDYKTIER